LIVNKKFQDYAYKKAWFYIFVGIKIGSFADAKKALYFLQKYFMSEKSLAILSVAKNPT